MPASRSAGSVWIFSKLSRRSALAACSVLFVAAMIIFVFGEPPDQTLLWDALFDVGHALLFGFVIDRKSTRLNSSH